MIRFKRGGYWPALMVEAKRYSQVTTLVAGKCANLLSYAVRSVMNPDLFAGASSGDGNIQYRDGWRFKAFEQMQDWKLNLVFSRLRTLVYHQDEFNCGARVF